VHLARFTHHSRQVLHASTKMDRTYQYSNDVWRATDEYRLLAIARSP
jgi:hypothetical protein